jgi:SAUR family protein
LTTQLFFFFETSTTQLSSSTTQRRRRRRRAIRHLAIMMVMGYFRTPKKGGGWMKKNSAAREEAAGHREALLEPGSSEGALPKGYFAVYVGEEARRFVVPTGYLREPAFRDLMQLAADEFGFAQAAGLHVPCAEEDFEELLRRLSRKNGGSGSGKGKKAI